MRTARKEIGERVIIKCADERPLGAREHSKHEGGLDGTVFVSVGARRRPGASLRERADVDLLRRPAGAKAAVSPRTLDTDPSTNLDTPVCGETP
jgi:hypothetical protein